MANGFLRIQGQQINIPVGSWNDGPTLIPYSPTFEVIPIAAGVTNLSTTVPTTAQGVIITPVIAGTLSVGSVTAQLTRISSISPTIICFELASVPTAIFITTVTATCSLRFF